MLAATIFWRTREPTQYPPDEAHLTQELEWMHTEEHQPESAAAGSGGMGIDDTP